MLLLCTHVSPADIGGVAASARRWARGAQALGNDVLWCWTDNDSIHWCRNLDENDIETTSLETDEIIAVVQNRKVSSCMIHYATRKNCWAEEIIRKLHLPLILNFRGNDTTNGIFEENPPFETLVFSATHLVFVAEHLRLLVESRFGDLSGRATVVPNWLSAGEIEKFQRRVDAERSTVFCLSGIWKWKKGLEVVFDALLKKSELVSQFKLYGDMSKCSQNVHRKYSELIERGLHPIERFAPADVADIYGACKVVVIPSLVEGMPNAMTEAAAAGCAILGSAIPGIEEIVGRYNIGELFVAGDADDLGDKILKLLAEPSLIEMYGRRARETAEKMALNPWQYLPIDVRRKLRF